MELRLLCDALEFQGEPLWVWRGSDRSGAVVEVELYEVDGAGFVGAEVRRRPGSRPERVVFVCEALWEFTNWLERRNPEARAALIAEGEPVVERARERWEARTRAHAKLLAEMEQQEGRKTDAGGL